jgi:L-2-hydroxyglutarate oxidase LhgO
MSEHVEAVVVGAGVVGLAVARALAMAGREVIVLERHGLIGSETSSRNSEVIHAGIYYPTGSAKAELCVRGKHRLYAYSKERGIPHEACGKLIVATSEGQLAELERIEAKAAENGVTDLEFWDAARARALEPALACTGALWSPSTGIIDSHALMLAYQGDLEDAGGMIAFNASLERATVTADGFALEVGGETPMELACSILVNSAGLDAPHLARRIEGYDPAHAPAAYYCKGSYYTLPGKSPFSRLIYPVPEAAGLGVHVTIDLGGQCRFGPDTEWIEAIDYDVDPRRADVFYEAVRKYWPELPDNALEPGYSGIRPKTQPKGVASADFTIQGPAEHGTPGLVHLYGIESPGLTASLAIGEAVARRLAA